MTITAVGGGPGWDDKVTGLTPVEGKHRWKARLIMVGEGASAFYPEEALRSSFAQAFPPGTRINIDHQTDDEPEYVGDGMYAEVAFSDQWAPFIESFHQVIGLSISGQAEIDQDAGESAGGKPVVKSFIPHPLNTVDVVTEPGAGGRFIEALESFRGNMTIDSNQPKGDDAGMKPEDIAAISTAVSEALKNVLDKRDKEKADAKKAEDQAKLDAEKAKAEEEDKKKKDKEKKTKESIAAAVEAIADADLPSAFRRRVAEGFARGEDVKDLIKEQVELIESARSEQGVRPREADGGSDYDKAFAELKW